MTEAGEFAGFLAFGAGLLGLFLGPVGAALAKRIAGRREVDADGMAELASRTAELEDRLQGMNELEERLDFAERLLAQQRGGETGRLKETS